MKPHVTCQGHGTGRAGKQQGEKPREEDISCPITLQEVSKIQMHNSTPIKLTSKLMTKQCNDPSRAINKAVELFQMHVDTAADLNSEFLQLSVDVVLTSGTNTSPGVFGQSVLWVLQGH